MQQPGKQKSYVECPGGLYYEQYTCFTYHPAAYPWRGTCLIVPPLAYHTICIVLHLQQFFLSNAAPFCFQLHFFLIHMFIYDLLHPYILVQLNTPGAYVSRIMV